MRSSKIYLSAIFLLLFACSSAPGRTPTLLIPTQGNPVVLPPTWTHTPTSLPSQTPASSPTFTFTPLPSATPLPATLTSSPTSNVPTITVTSTITPTVDNRCNVTATEDGVSIHSSPFIDPYRVLPNLSPMTTYQATKIYPPYYELELNDQPVGWVDYRLRSLKSQGDGCDQLPFDTRELTDFPDLCFFLTDSGVEVYSDRALTEPYQTITSTKSYILLLKYSDVFYTSAGESGPGFFVDSDQVNTSGACEKVPYAGLTITNTWLWSQPDGELGEQLEKLTPAKRLFIQRGPIRGARPPSITTEGVWYFVLVSPPNDDLSGWVWSSHIIIE